MSDRTSAEIFGCIFTSLAAEYDDAKHNGCAQLGMINRLKLEYWDLAMDYDFSWNIMDCDDALETLGLLSPGTPEKFYDDREYGPVVTKKKSKK